MRTREEPWQGQARALKKTVFNGQGPHSDSPGDGDPQVLRCPACGTGYGGVHVLGADHDRDGYLGSVRATVTLECEYGCVTVIVFGNYKGNGYVYWEPSDHCPHGVVMEPRTNCPECDAEAG